MFGLTNTLEDYKCEICFHQQEKTLQHNSYDFSLNNCVILKFKIAGYDHKFLNLEVNEFNENHVVIPGDHKSNFFVVKAAIVFTPSNNDNTEIGGHYVCWRRARDGWLEISDTTSTYKNKFIKNLKNVYLLFLEKKHLSNI